MEIRVVATVKVPGLHYFKEANGNTEFLRYAHRHEFRIVAEVKVTDENREVEFFELAERVNDVLGERYSFQGSMIDFKWHSCESIAIYLLETLNLSDCEVWEDEGFGAKVCR